MERRDMVLAHWLEFQNGKDENAPFKKLCVVKRLAQIYTGPRLNSNANLKSQGRNFHKIPYSTPTILINLYIKKANMPVCPESMHRARWFYDTMLLEKAVTNKLDSSNADPNLSRIGQYAYFGLGVVDRVKRKVADLEPLEPFLYTVVNTIRDWVNGEDVDVSAPVLALIQESTMCGYADFDIIMDTLPLSTILDTLLETERSTNEC